MSDIPVIPPYCPEDFSKLWVADYNGKTILDIGADRGSTASYFLRNGAKYVVCVEGDPERYRLLEANLPSLRNATAIFKYINSPSDMQNILWINSADIVKIDVEGAEKYLLPLAPYTIQYHPEYMIEMHLGVSMDAMVNLFQRSGYSVTYGARSWLGDWQIIHCKRVQNYP